jgi:hypothetical protein
MAGGHFSFQVPTLVDLEGAEFPAPFIISGQSKPANQPTILTLQRANVSGLAMTGIDLTKCDVVTMQVFVREDGTMIAAPVQCDVDGVPKRSHFARVPPMG